jgi:ribonuclease E
MLETELHNSESENGREAEPQQPALSSAGGAPAAVFQAPQALFQAPASTTTPAAKRSADSRSDNHGDSQVAAGHPAEDSEDDSGTARKRRRRTTKTRAKAEDSQESTDSDQTSAAESPAPKTAAKAAAKGRGKTAKVAAEPAESAAPSDDAGEEGDTGTPVMEDEETEAGGNGTARRRRRKRRRGGADSVEASPDDPPDTVVHVREAASPADAVRAVKGSTRLEAKKQRRREGRESGRRRPPIVTESEFLARRESVERNMVVRQRGDRIQIAVLEDGVLVEHYVNRTTHQSYVGNVYLGKVQNVLPSMEAAFVDIGKGRNAVLYAGEVNWDISGLEGQPKRIESALRPGQSVIVQVTKDPVGHKGARLTSMISLPGRYLVYVPGASMTGISRKLPDTERNRLKGILKKVMPENGGVIVRTAAEGAAEDELSHDVARLAAQWESIEKKSKSASAPSLLYGEPDLTIRVVRDVFNEDFGKLIVSGSDGWDTIDEYVKYVAPHLADRLERWDESGKDVFAAYRIDEQLAKALERKVWLPSGGSLVIDRTEAMTVIDVNTGKFTGQGGNLEETVTRNNLEAAEEIVRQLRLRDVGGIVVIDFIDMVLESNRELVLRRLLECLARDRTKHQVAEVTSLGLVQMTRKRVGAGLLEAFSETCDCCNGRGVIITTDPMDASGPASAAPAEGGGSPNGRGKSRSRSHSQENGHRPGKHAAAPAEAAPAAKAAPASSAPAPAGTAGPSAETGASAAAASAETGAPAAAAAAEASAPAAVAVAERPAPVSGRRTRGGTATVRRSAPGPVAVEANAQDPQAEDALFAAPAPAVVVEAPAVAPPVVVEAPAVAPEAALAEEPETPAPVKRSRRRKATPEAEASE